LATFHLHPADRFPFQQWDACSRGWKRRKDVQEIGLLIADDLQLIGSGDVGATYEVVLSRTRYVSAQTDMPTRIVGLSVSLANARDIGEWLGAPASNVFNFSPRYVVPSRQLSNNLLIAVLETARVRLL
jgi:replicative superfamily II helicase